MADLGYGVRGPLVNKLKELVTDIQTIYESFLDAQTLYEQGKLSEKDFFARMGDFLRAFASLGFLTVKVVVELDSAIGKSGDAGEESKKPAAVTRPSPTLTSETMAATMSRPTEPIPKAGEGGGEDNAKSCVHCSAKIPKAAKFCTKCGKPQG